MHRRGLSRRARLLTGTGAALGCLTLPLGALAQDTGEAGTLDAIEVEGTPIMAPGPSEDFTVDPTETTPPGVDSADLVSRKPGYSVNDNGPISGQVQHRGMFGPRMNVRIDGMYVNPGGPNWMDPPLHYAPSGLIAEVEADRGISPVSAGAESIGGSVNAELKESSFARTDTVRVDAEVEGTVRSAHRAGGGSGFVEAVTRRHRMHAMTSGSKGGDIAFPGGEIEASRHERYMVGGGYGVRLAPGHELAVDVRHHETDDTGNPALPMDIRFFDTNILKSSYTGDTRLGTVTAELSYSDIDHRMDNVTLRDLGSANPRRVDAESTGIGWSLGLARGIGPGTLRVGVEGHLAGHEMNIRNPRNDAFFVRNFEDVDRDRYSAFGEWSGAVSERVEVELGTRVTRVEMDAGRVATGAAPGAPPVQRLVNGFNSGDRDAGDTLVDATARISYAATDSLTLIVEGGRKTRSPSYIERFAWLPIEATAGLADGNNHIGRVGLDPEVAHEVSVGADWTTSTAYFRPRVFYRDVDDFITGTPFDDTPGTVDSDVERVSRANGDPTPLIYSNTGAEFYGFDVDFGYRFTERLRLDGQVSLTRAERTDIDDNVYRVPPANGNVRLTYTQPDWRAFVGTELAADEDRISETNNDPSTEDPRTAGHAIVNLGGQWSITEGADLGVKVTNLFDDSYEQQLGGFNRVPNSDVDQGDRLPGTGRSVIMRFKARF